MRLDDKVALITGGASGMGASMARIFAREGAKVAINFQNNEAKAREVAEEITKFGGTCLPAQANLERLLRPQLRFHFAGDIATYATSDAFEPDPRANEDLEGLMFPDMPWMLGGELADAVRSAAHDAWPSGGPHRGRLFAFGFDAYRLAVQVFVTTAIGAQPRQHRAGLVIVRRFGDVLDIGGLALLTQELDDFLDLLVRHERPMHAGDPAAPLHIQHVAHAQQLFGALLA